MFKRFLALFIYFVCLGANADWLDYYLDMKCDPDGVTIIKPSDIYNTKVEQRVAECKLSSGDEIKIKFGIGEYHEFGGGADPSKWLSLWVNKAKIFSGESIGCFAGGVCSKYFKFSNNLLEVCVLKGGYKAEGGVPDINHDFNCQKTLLENLNKERDYAEFPEEISNALKVGETGVFFDKNKDFCRQFIDGGKFKLPTNAKPFVENSTANYEYAGSYGRLAADFNNDGKIDSVYVLHSKTRFQHADSYYIFTQENNTIVNWPNVNFEQLEQNRDFIFPAQWGGCSLKEGCSFSQFNDIELFIPAPNSKGLFSFWSRYTHSTPFKLSGVTYFHIYAYPNRGTTAIIKPLPNGSSEHMCYFYEGKENY